MKFQNIEDPEDIIEFIAFNYDGKGSALYMHPNSLTIYEMSAKEVQTALVGGIPDLPKYELLKETPNQK